MIHDSFADVYDEQCQDLKILIANTDATNEDDNGDERSVDNFKLRQNSITESIAFSLDEESITDSANGPASTPRKLSEPNISPLADDSGWKCSVSTQNMVAETSSVCTMSHVFVPFNENSSILSTLSMAIKEQPSQLARYNTYDSSHSASLSNRNGNGSYLFSSLTKNRFALNKIRNSLSSASVKRQNKGNNRRLSAVKCHEDIVFHTLEEYSAENSFLPKPPSITSGENFVCIPSSSTKGSNIPSMGLGAENSPISSLNHSLSSSYSSVSLISKANTRTATTLPQLPILKTYLDSGILETGKTINRKGPCVYPTSPIASKPQATLKSKSSTKPNSALPFSAVYSPKQDDLAAASTATLSTEPNTNINSGSNSKQSSATVPNEPSDFAKIFSSGDTTSTASFFSTLLQSPKPLSEQHVSESSPNSSSDSERSLFSQETSVTYESVEIPEKSACCIDVSPLELSDITKFGSIFLEPIVLPPIVGHIEEFHPDFAVQACSPSNDIDNKITQAMIQDSWSFKYDDEEKCTDNIDASDDNSIPLTSPSLDSKLRSDQEFRLDTPSSYFQSFKSPMASFGTHTASTNYVEASNESGDYGDAKEIVSKTLVIDLNNMKIVEHTLVRESTTTQIMYRNNLFCKGKPVTPAVGEGMASVESQLSKLIAHTFNSLQSSNAGSLFDNNIFGSNYNHDVSTKETRETQKGLGSFGKNESFSNDKYDDILKRCYDLRFDLLNCLH